MLRFTNTQLAFVINHRRQWEASQQALRAQGVMIGNAETLPRDVWGQWDREGIEVQRPLMRVFNDLAASVSTPMAIGKLMHHFQTISDSGEVNISLDGRSKARTDQPVFAYHGTPLPIWDSMFSFGWRQMAAAATEGFQLDAAGRNNSNFKVAEKAEDIVLNGDSNIVVDGNTLYGLRNHPKRATRATGQTLNGATGAQWKADVVATLKLLHNNNFKTPATLYVNWDDWFYASNTDYKTENDKSIAQRVREIDGVREVVASDKVSANDIIAVIKDRRVVQLLNGMPMNTRPRARLNTEDDYDFVTMMAAALEIKYDATDQIGLAHSAL